MASLAKLTAPRARVVRGGRSRVVPASEVVRGDLLVLEAGDLVAADGRLIEAAALRTNEAPLTGESEPVDKHAGRLTEDTVLADRRNVAMVKRLPDVQVLPYSAAHAPACRALLDSWSGRYREAHGDGALAALVPEPTSLMIAHVTGGALLRRRPRAACSF